MRPTTMIVVSGLILGACGGGSGERAPSRARAVAPPDTGGGAGASAPTAGQIVITEIMPAPPQQYDEWFELLNTTTEELELGGCVLDSTGTGSTQQHTIEGSLVVPAGGRVLLNKEVESTAELVCIDDLDVCAAPAAYRFKTLTFSNSDPDTLVLICGAETVDEVTFDWSSFDGDCDDLMAAGGAAGGCALQLAPEREAGSDNADATSWGSWGLPPADLGFVDARDVLTLGSPGAQGSHATLDTGGDDTDTDEPDDTDTAAPELPADACTEGQAILTEFMPAPKDSGYNDEWIEVKGLLGGGSCNIHACTVEIAYPEGEVYKSLVLDDADGEIQVPGGEYVVLARGSSDEVAAGIQWVNGADGATTSAAFVWGYNDLALPDCVDNACEWTVTLRCGDRVVDQAPMSMDAFEEQASTCPDGGCSVNLHQDFETVDGNDQLDRWCVPTGEENTWTYTHPADDDGSVEVTTLYGTPGRVGSCPELDWPAVGEIVFTELMPSPAGTNEWLELYNLADRTVELTLCELVRYRLDETGAVTSEQTYTLGGGGQGVAIAPGAVQVFAKNGCILDEDESADSGDTGASLDCSWGELPYGSLSFTDGETETVELRCPSADLSVVVVDGFSYNTEVQGIRSGHSLSYDPSGVDDPATGNDDADAWCEAGFSQEFCDLGEGDCNYGSPGAIAPCSTETDWPEGRVCRCASARPAAALPPALLALAALVLRRRRTRI